MRPMPALSVSCVAPFDVGDGELDGDDPDVEEGAAPATLGVPVMGAAVASAPTPPV